MRPLLELPPYRGGGVCELRGSWELCCLEHSAPRRASHGKLVAGDEPDKEQFKKHSEDVHVFLLLLKCTSAITALIQLYESGSVNCEMQPVS